MSVLVDSSVILDLFTNDPLWRSWSEQQLVQRDLTDELVINDIIWAECSGSFSRIEDYRVVMDELAFSREPLSEEALFLATKVFITYRRSGGTKFHPLPDFFIGAHAAVSGHSVLTRDPTRIRNYFPKVHLIYPK
ncbi:MAG TPA: type II toxin-antitoxin system VapC family toxin [Treponema sp.]|nr:type II toxin-antitoxin system VapC family toxin [Treponema sp.]